MTHTAHSLTHTTQSLTHTSQSLTHAPRTNICPTERPIESRPSTIAHLTPRATSCVHIGTTLDVSAILDESCPSSDRHVTHVFKERTRLHEDRHTQTHTRALPSSLSAEAEPGGVSERLPGVGDVTIERARLHQDTYTHTHTHTHTHTLPMSWCSDADARDSLSVLEREAGCSKAQAVQARDDWQEVYGVEMGSRGARQIVVRATAATALPIMTSASGATAATSAVSLVAARICALLVDNQQQRDNAVIAMRVQHHLDADSMRDHYTRQQHTQKEEGETTRAASSRRAGVQCRVTLSLTPQVPLSRALLNSSSTTV